jgi:hypothetical protein
LPTSPRSSRAGLVSPALATIRQLAAKLISTPNSAASPSANHCGPVSGVTGSSPSVNLPTSAGATAPTASPARMAVAAIRPISASSMVSTVRRVAPTSFRMAIDGRREAAKAAAALDMPSPPIASADSATSSSICPSRSMKRRVPAPASSRLVARQPPSGKRFWKDLPAASASAPGPSKMR